MSMLGVFMNYRTDILIYHKEMPRAVKGRFPYYHQSFVHRQFVTA